MPAKTKIVENARLWIKDIIYIFLFLCTVAGFFINNAVNKAKDRAAIEANTKSINDLAEAMKEYNKSFLEQAKFNGQVMQYMQMDMEDSQ